MTNFLLILIFLLYYKYPKAFYVIFPFQKNLNTTNWCFHFLSLSFRKKKKKENHPTILLALFEDQNKK